MTRTACRAGPSGSVHLWRPARLREPLLRDASPRPERSPHADTTPAPTAAPAADPIRLETMVPPPAPPPISPGILRASARTAMPSIGCRRPAALSGGRSVSEVEAQSKREGQDHLGEDRADEQPAPAPTPGLGLRQDPAHRGQRRQDEQHVDQRESHELLQRRGADP